MEGFFAAFGTTPLVGLIGLTVVLLAALFGVQKAGLPDVLTALLMLALVAVAAGWLTMVLNIPMFHDVLYEETYAGVFVLITVLLGGAGAWMTGRACASTWRPYYVLVLYLIILAAAVRFMHMALFQGTLLSAHYFLSDLVVVQIIGALGYRFTRTRQMVSKYSWLFRAAGAFGWSPAGGAR